MRPGSAGRYFSAYLTDNTTLTTIDVTKKGLFVFSVGGKALTIPPASWCKKYKIAVASLSTNSGNTTIAASDSSTFIDGTASITQAAGGFIEMESNQTASGTWVWFQTVPTSTSATGGASVVDETVYGVAKTAGAAATWSRSDHTHGSMADPATAATVTATFTPTHAWGTATPTISAGIYRKEIMYKRAKWSMDITCSDGKGATTLTSTFPTGLVPSNVSTIFPVDCLVSVNAAAYASYPAYVIANSGTPANNILTVLIPTLTNAQAAHILLQGSHEVT